jgi:microcystin-dependent protein
MGYEIQILEKLQKVENRLAQLEKIDRPSGGSVLDAYPVGAIYIAVSSTSPATLFGGTWQSFGAGRVLVGIDTGDADFNTVEETGGAKTHTLTTAEMPNHTHIQNSHNHTQDSHNHTQNAHNHTMSDNLQSHSHGIKFNQTAGGGTTDPRISSTGVVTSYGPITNEDTPHQHTIYNKTPTNNATTATNNATTATNQNTGGDGAHNNLQPYITVYMWKRTA